MNCKLVTARARIARKSRRNWTRDSYDALVKVWLGRLATVDSRIAAAFSDPEGADSGVGQSRSMRRRLMDDAEPLTPSNVTTALARNIAALAEVLGIKEIEQQILAFVVMLATHTVMREICVEIVRCSTERMHWLVGVALDCDASNVSAALQKNSPLVACGLIRIDSDLTELSCKLVLREGLTSVLLDQHTKQSLLECFFEAPAPSALTLADYPHLAEDAALLKMLLASAIASECVGVNVLLHGPPGTGKTEFAKALAAAVNATLYAVQSADNDGRSAHRTERLTAYKLCLNFVKAQGGGIVLFDEVEDVFPHNWQAEMAIGGRLSKAWVNALLESNPVPTIWIANVVEDVDPAYLRRFDFSLELGIPPLAVRKRIYRKCLGQDIAESTLDALAQRPELSPGQLQHAARVAAMLAPSGADFSAVVTRTVQHSAKLLGQKSPSNERRDAIWAAAGCVDTDLS